LRLEVGLGEQLVQLGLEGEAALPSDLEDVVAQIRILVAGCC